MQVYLDNSSTSWPKPETVLKAMGDYLNNFGASPGRSGHQFSLRAAREVFECREMIASLFNLPDSDKVIFTFNATHAINIALKGFLKKNDHVIVSSMEHNSVFRPLSHMRNQGIIEITVVEPDGCGKTDTKKLRNSFKPNTKLVLINHGSNVFGILNPLEEIGDICREKGVVFMVDTAQTAGFIPINMQKNHISLLAFTGHKKLNGPTGIGGLCINGNLDIEGSFQGGTGSKSEMETHPDFYPDKLEAGTPNTLGIIGLKAGINHVLNKGLDQLKKEQLALTSFFVKELKKIQEITIYYPDFDVERLPIVSINIKNTISSDVAYQLDSKYGIMVRAGLHCTPQAHKMAGTFPQGTVRFSFSTFNTEEEIIYTADAIKNIIIKNQLK
jgi:cysteine desulfurase/selenocysteine lyase